MLQQPAAERVDRVLDTNGDGSGLVAAIGDYSVTPGRFYYQAQSRGVYISRMIVLVRDTGNFAAAIYGAGSSLANGMTLKVEDGSGNVIHDLTAGLTVCSNMCWSRYCYDVTYFAFGAGDNFLGARWTFTRAGSPLGLRDQHMLVVELNDDMSFLVDHTFTVQGYLAEGG